MQLTDILLTILIITSFCVGWRMITDEGMLFAWVREWARGCKHKFLLKPFVLCVTCFASFWGVIIFGILHGITFEMLPYLIICCISASFTNTITWNLYDK